MIEKMSSSGESKSLGSCNCKCRCNCVCSCLCECLDDLSWMFGITWITDNRQGSPSDQKFWIMGACESGGNIA